MTTKRAGKKPHERSVNSPAPEGPKDEAARKLAHMHFVIDPGMRQIFRLETDGEWKADEPIKVLEVNENTVQVGIVPVFFGPSPQLGIPYPCVIVEITPEEFVSLQNGHLRLPHGWRLSQEYKRRKAARRR